MAWLAALLALADPGPAKAGETVVAKQPAATASASPGVYDTSDDDAPGSGPAGAGNSPSPAPDGPPWREVWGGAELTRKAWSAYAGTTVALDGTLADDGWRLRSVSGGGRYRSVCKIATARGRVQQSCLGTSAFSDVLVGYQHRIGPTTFKVFLGAAFDSQVIRPHDPGNPGAGRAYGVRAAFESWTELGRRAWLSLDLGWTGAHAAAEARSRFGYRLLPDLSVGLEASARGTGRVDATRAGAFVRYDWGTGEISAAAGIADGFSNGAFSPDSAAAYGSVNVLVKY